MCDSCRMRSTVRICYNYAIDRVESVQRKFTKRLRGCKGMDYSARLDHLQLQSLERRRINADLVLTYRIISVSYTHLTLPTILRV